MRKPRSNLFPIDWVRTLCLALCFAGVAVVDSPESSAQAPQAAEETPLERPLRASFRVEGRSTPLKGEITAWSFGAYWIVREGGETPVRVDWSELDANQVFASMRRILERDDAAGHLRLGVAMLGQDEARIAGRVFAIAQRIDPGLEETIEAVRRAHEAGEDPMSALGSNPGAPAPEPAPTGQPPASTGDNAQALSPDPGVRADTRAEALLKPFERIESEHFIVLVQECRITAEQFSLSLERIHERFAEVLQPGGEAVFFDSKCVCYLVNNDFDLRAVTTQIRAGDRSIGKDGRSNYLRSDRGGVVEFVFMDTEDHESTVDLLIFHDIARAILDHHISSRRLPRWVEVGTIRSVLLSIHQFEIDERELIRSVREYCKYNSVGVFIKRSVEKFDSYTALSQNLSHFLVRSLLTQKPDEFRQWVRRMKLGEDWEFSLESCMGFDVDSLGVWFERQLGVEEP